jgi:hypothetical protein
VHASAFAVPPLVNLGGAYMRYKRRQIIVRDQCHNIIDADDDAPDKSAAFYIGTLFDLVSAKTVRKSLS